MDKYLPHDDELGLLINSASAELHKRLENTDADNLGMPEHCLHYYKASHSKRLFFSIETSAHLLYRSIRLTGKRPADITVMDYGAGIGTLFLLAKMVGCKQVVYNDHMEDWRVSAELLAKTIGVHIDHYIVGDIGDCLDRLDEYNIECDLIVSRNVLEHIYKLEEFFSSVYRKQPGAIIFSSTTANHSNPAAAFKHKRWHRKWEKMYHEKRKEIIEKQLPNVTADQKEILATATRGLASEDLEKAIREFDESEALPDPTVYGSNTCNPYNGVWAENMISISSYRKLVGESRYTVRFEAGFWDTHYKQPFMNRIAAMLNHIIARGERLAMTLAPFMYVVAIPKHAR
jgi:2-polyprenyl-3-methyl-5-hydroxy-6-metoxy-1,4-benzoquinol methylase